MPTYEYMVLDEGGNETGEIIEIVHSIKSPALTIDPDSNRPIRRMFGGGSMLLVDPSQPKTVGGLADKNTAKMIAEGDPRIKPAAKPPWWRDTKKPKDFSGYSKTQLENYLHTGQK